MEKKEKGVTFKKENLEEELAEIFEQIEHAKGAIARYEVQVEAMYAKMLELQAKPDEKI